MPLIPCPDCNTEISDTAPACLKCGRPMAGTPARGTAPIRSGLLWPGLIALASYLMAENATTGVLMLLFSVLMLLSGVLFGVRVVRRLWPRR